MEGRHFKMNNDFRPPSRQPRQRPVDGILGAAPNRPRLQPSASRRPVTGSEFRTNNNRAIGDFKRPEGYHAANVTIGEQKTARATRKASEDASLLHNNLVHAKNAKQTPDASKKKGRDWRKIRKWALWGFIGIVAIVILLGGFLFAKGYFKANKVFKGGGSSAALNDQVDPSLLKAEGDGRINILLTGRGGDGHDGADLTDTILIASIDPIGNTAGLVSIPRDLWVSTSSGGSSKINAVYAQAKNNALRKNAKNVKAAEEAGIKALQKKSKEILGISIHYYAAVDFTAFKLAVDTVGGVDIEVPENLAVKEKLWDPSIGKNYYLNVPAGKQHFDGQRALFFARSRHTSTRGDFDRAERQRLFIAALSQEVLSAGTYTNPVKISKLMDDFGDHVATDMSINDAVRLAQIGKRIGGKFDSVDLADPLKPLVKTGMINGQSVVMPAAGNTDYSDIQALIRTRFKDGYIAKENATVMVLNGTTMPGLASQKAEVLKGYGYNVTTVADAPSSSYTETVIVDLNKSNQKKPYTKNYLEKRFDVKATTKLPDQTIQPGTANFVIILGSNETTNL
jgi:LCP family protein required for cell wall assembly